MISNNKTNSDAIPDNIPEWPTKNKNFKELIKEKLKGQHFMRHIGFSLTRIEAGLIEGQAPLKKVLTQQDGFVHGGATATVSDIVTGFAAFTLVEPDMKVVSSNLNISYFRPGSGHTLKARGWVIKPGSRLFYCEGIIWTEHDKGNTIIAKVNSIMAAFRPGKYE